MTPVWKVKRMSFPGFAARYRAARSGTKRTPRVRSSPRRMTSSPRPTRRSSSTPSSRVARVFRAQARNCWPKWVSFVPRPLFSKSGTPSSDSSWAMAWLRLGWVMQSLSAARV